MIISINQVVVYHIILWYGLTTPLCGIPYHGMEHPGSWHWTPPGGMVYQDAGEGGGTPKDFLKMSAVHVPENIENLKISCISV